MGTAICPSLGTRRLWLVFFVFFSAFSPDLNIFPPSLSGRVLSYHFSLVLLSGFTEKQCVRPRVSYFLKICF